MSDIKLFNVSNGSAQELQGSSIAIEKTLQTLIENHLEVFLGVRFLATEHSTGKTHGGRIDTLGIDENDAITISVYWYALSKQAEKQKTHTRSKGFDQREKDLYASKDRFQKEDENRKKKLSH